MDLGLPSVWHAFTTTECADVTIRYCGTSPAFTTTWNWLAVTCPADALVNATSFNTTDCGNGNKTLFFADLPAGTYYLPVLNEPVSGTNGPYNIAVSTAACGGFPINDLCTNVSAQDIGMNATLTFTGNNTGASFAGDAVPGSVMDLGLPSVWHAFTLSECANVTIRYCGTTPAFGNTWNWLALSCPADGLVNASSFNNTDCGNGNKTLFFSALAAGTYYLPVLNDPFNDAQGPYSITVSTAICPGSTPSNDLCTNVVAQDLSLGGSLTFTGDNTGATFAGDAVPGSVMDLGLPSVWHAFTTTECMDVRIRYCGIAPAFGNTWNWLAQNCPANALVNASSFNTTDCGDGNKTLNFDQLPAGTYYLPVLLDPFSDAQGPYSILVETGTCGGVPVNDLCTSVSAQTLAMGGSLTFSGDNTGATFPGDAAPGSAMDLGLASVWHAFTIAECADVVVSYCGITPAFANTWNWLTTTCPAELMVNASSFNDTTCIDGNKTIYFNDLPAGTYYLPILADPFSGTVGSYSVLVSAEPCSSLPPNDLCSNVQPEVLPTGGSLTFSGNNTNATFEGDAVPGSMMDLGLPSVWHAFTTNTCTDVTVSYCGIEPAFGNTWNWLARNCPAQNLVNATSFETNSCNDGNKTLYFTGLPPGTYYLPVLTDPFAGSEGPYSITVSAEQCSGVPINDLCTSLTQPVPVVLGSPVTFTGNNAGATLQNDAVPGSVIHQLGLPNVWHYFTLPECAALMVEYCGTDPAFSNVWSLLATSCPANAVLLSTSNNSVDCGDGNRTAYYEQVPVGNYYLPVLSDSFSGSVGPYSVTVTATNSCTVPVSGMDADWSVVVGPGSDLYLRTGTLNGILDWQLMDTAGRLLRTSSVQATPGETQVLHVGTDMVPGVYLLQIVHASGRSAKRLFIP